MISFLKKKNSLKTILIIDAILILTLSIFAIFPSKPSEVIGLKVHATSFSSAQLEWKASKNANRYKIYRATGNNNFKFLTLTAKTKYNDTNLRTGTKYQYIVIAQNGLKTSSKNNKAWASVQPELKSPKLTVSTGTGKIQLSFSKVDGAKEYEIIRDNKIIAKIPETSYIDKEINDDDVHKYKVKAIRYKKNPVFSKESNEVKAELHPISNFIMKANEEEIKLDWDESDYYDKYKIYLDDNLLEETSDTGYNIEGYELKKNYDLKVVGYKNNIQSPEIERKFNITKEPMNNQAAIDAACDWGVAIANDDSFTYGTGDTAHHCGCYFCGTNIEIKGKKYEKTYCCNPFVHACFAHGAKDPQMLKTCQNGNSVGMEKSDYTRYGNWEDMGKPNQSDLKRGDVLIMSSHVMLYIGDGQIVHAGQEGWGANTISIDDCNSFYNSVKFVMRYTGNGGGEMFKINEVKN